MDDVYTDLENYGKIFGVEARHRVDCQDERDRRQCPNQAQRAAAKNHRVVILPYQNINPSAENAEGVLALAKGFYPALFK